MQQAAIIFVRSVTLSLDTLGEFLVSLGCTIEKTQWGLGKALGKTDSEIDTDKARDVLKRVIP